eukprot:CAMPEP_0184525888 /NCGR_PEP_ID=MMETSP0198_2-20121128/10354_1 /TAXON_ID=1112570 /ORGANISM="Thraustochytrium sp., Strain LLF1b" /LENGTH=405 /DNA_ID=CAMNT_0026917409 /DNA_START=46 /DNA_END=1260 /DNA_ORIENTATION=+
MRRVAAAAAGEGEEQEAWPMPPGSPASVGPGFSATVPPNGTTSAKQKKKFARAEASLAASSSRLWCGRKVALGAALVLWSLAYYYLVMLGTLSQTPYCGPHLEQRHCKALAKVKRSEWRFKLEEIIRGERSSLVNPGEHEHGVVIFGGQRVEKMLSHNVRQLRRVGFVLPIEVWHLNELSKKFCKTIFRKYGLVVCRNLADYGISRYTSRTEAKMLAVAFSTFNNVLLIDQNCVVLEDPTPLFSSQAFLKFGAVFWRGPHDSASWLSGATTKSNHVMFEVIDRPHDPNDIRYTSERGSGVLLVNKAACKLALDLSLIFLSEVGFYDQVAGAKGRELVRFAFLATDHKFYFVPEPVAIADVSDKHAPFLPELFCPNTLILFASKDLLVGSKGQKSRPLFVHKLHDW